MQLVGQIKAGRREIELFSWRAFHKSTTPPLLYKIIFFFRFHFSKLNQLKTKHASLFWARGCSCNSLICLHIQWLTLELSLCIFTSLAVKSWRILTSSKGILKCMIQHKLCFLSNYLYFFWDLRFHLQSNLLTLSTNLGLDACRFMLFSWVTHDSHKSIIIFNIA